jgi:type IVB pilus formation R64 PilN family outer membrane protein
MLIKKLSIALLAGCVALAGCNKYVAETNKHIEETLSRVEEYKEAAQIPDLPEPTDTVRMQNDIYLGNQSVKIMEGDSLPSWLEKDDGITIAMAEDATLADILQEISDITGMNIRLDDLRQENAIPENAVPLKYSGSLSGLLNYLANRYSIYWRYKDGIISFFTKETRIFTIYAMPTDATMTANMSGASSGKGGSGSSASSTLSVTSDLKIWDSIEEGVKQVVGENGQISFSRAAGTVTVTASPFIVRKVAAYVANWNEKLSRQVAITVRVLMVSLNNADQYGLDLTQIAFETKKISLGFTGMTSAFEGAAGLTMALIDKDSKFYGSNGAIQALSTQGKVRQVTSASVTTLNNKVAPVQVANTQNYLKSITVTTSTSSDNDSKDVDYDVQELNYGFTMEVLPRVLDHGRLILLFNLSLSDVVGWKYVDVGGSSSSTSSNEDSDSEEDDDDDDDEVKSTSLQLPTMEMRGFVQEIAMRSGQTLVLTGFEKIRDETQGSGVGKPKMGLLGGKAVNNNQRDVMVILLTPEVLQSPLSLC